MAVYFLRGGHVSRGKGGRVTRAAAYRAGEYIKDERTSETHNFSKRSDVVYEEMVLPAELAGRADMAWTQDRSTLWNAAEFAGVRRNSRLAREWLVLLPPELNPGQRSGLVRTFAQELADRYRCAVDVCIHDPRPSADSRNHHAHLLMTVREVTPDGFGPRTSLEVNGRERHEAGLGSSSRDEYLGLRERWAQITNEALQHAGHSARVDHRSLASQGSNREPTLTIPEKVLYAERKAGKASAVGDAIRARHRERLEARLISDAALARVVARQKNELRKEAAQHFKRRKTLPKQVRWNQLTRQERNAHRRAQYENQPLSPTAKESAQVWREFFANAGPRNPMEAHARMRSIALTRRRSLPPVVITISVCKERYVDIARINTWHKKLGFGLRHRLGGAAGRPHTRPCLG